MARPLKSIIIIGATSGIGAEIARQLITQGWRVGVAGRRIEELEKLVDIAPERVVTQRVDLNTEECANQIQTLLAKMGKVDIYLHCSGIGRQNQELDIEIEMATVATNGDGFMRSTITAFNHFRGCGGGHIAAITSVAGVRGGGNAPAYSATKAMQSTYIDSLAQLSNMERLNITFSDILPGFVATPLLRDHKYPMLMDVEYAAAKIIKALKSRRRRAVIDWKYSLLIFVWRLIPKYIWERLNIRG
ncbi:MAG: SDR family NAD(P)-dependent oxidoreductase [Rikenellaceae bacterium]